LKKIFFLRHELSPKNISAVLVLFFLIVSGLLARPSLAEYALSRANYNFNGGAYNLSAAGNWYKAADFLGSNSDFVHYQLARIYFVENNLDGAKKEIDIALVKNPNNQRAFYIRGLIDGFAKNYEEAISDFEKFTVWSPQEWAGWNDLAWVSYEAGDYAKAKNAALEGLKIDAENPWLLNNLGLAYLGLEEKNEAQAIFAKAKNNAEVLTLEKWKKAYPGNNPNYAEWNLAEFRANVKYNTTLAFIQNPSSIALSGIAASACAASSYGTCSGGTCNANYCIACDSAMDEWGLWDSCCSHHSSECSSNSDCCSANCNDAGDHCSGDYIGNCGQTCQGTKYCCEPNGCESWTCIGQWCDNGCDWCNDGCNWVEGTQNCCTANDCAANTCAGDWCQDSCGDWVEGTQNCCASNQGEWCSSAPNACGGVNWDQIPCDGSCPATTPANPPGYGDWCSSAPNACGGVNWEQIQCDGCLATTPANPSGYGDWCSSAPNACGGVNWYQIQCDGCLATTPANPSGYGDWCSSAPNACGGVNWYQIQCDGCLATTPANPWYYNTTCYSGYNDCSHRNSGAYDCNQVCSATIPAPEANCNDSGSHCAGNTYTGNCGQTCDGTMPHPLPTVSLRASSGGAPLGEWEEQKGITLGEGATLTWSTTNAVGCWGWPVPNGADGAWEGYKSTGASEDVFPTATANPIAYYINCWNNCNEIAEARVTFNVIPLPTTSLSISKEAIKKRR